MTKQEMRDFAQSQVEWYTKEIEWDRKQIKRINEDLIQARKNDKEMATWAMEHYPDDRFAQEHYKEGYKSIETKKLLNQRSKYYREIKKFQACVEQYKQEIIKYSNEAQTTTETTTEKEEQNMESTNTKKISFEIRQLDAWGNAEDGYDINTSYNMGEMTTKAQNERKAFTSWLKNHCGISFKNNRTLIEFDGDCYTIIDRKTKEPLFIAIPQY